MLLLLQFIKQTTLTILPIESQDDVWIC